MPPPKWLLLCKDHTRLTPSALGEARHCGWRPPAGPRPCRSTGVKALETEEVKLEHPASWPPAFIQQACLGRGLKNPVWQTPTERLEQFGGEGSRGAKGSTCLNSPRQSRGCEPCLPTQKRLVALLFSKRETEAVCGSLDVSWIIGLASVKSHICVLTFREGHSGTLLSFSLYQKGQNASKLHLSGVPSNPRVPPPLSAVLPGGWPGWAAPDRIVRVLPSRRLLTHLKFKSQAVFRSHHVVGK